MNAKNPLLRMLADKQIPLGMQCFTAEHSLLEVIGLSGFDFVMIDSEHSGNDPRAMEGVCRTADSVGLFVFVRVSEHGQKTEIRRALEAGAGGVFLPLVRSVDDIRHAADAAFFPPDGRRGICPSIRAGKYNWREFEDYARWNNEEVLLVPMIEQPEAVDVIEDICAMDVVKMIVFAAGDLAYAMGEGGKMMESPLVQEAYRKVLAAAKAHGVAVIGGPILDPTPESCRKSIESGVTVQCLGLDALAFRKVCEQTVAALNAGVEGTGYSRPAAPPSAFKV